MNASEIIPYIFSGWRLPVVLGIVLIVGGIILWAYSGGHDIGRKENNLAVNEGIDQGENTIVSNLVVNQNAIVEQAANNTNQAVNDFHNSVNRDSNQFHGSSSDRFCERFPDDSTCGEWRKQHGR